MNRAYLPFLAALALTGSLRAADATDGSQPVDVPDPIGLGERLALIDWLHEHKIEFPADTELPALRILYIHAVHPEWFADDQEELEAREVVSAALWTRHGVNADPKLSVVELQAALKKLDEELSVKHAKQREDQLAAGGGPEPEKPASDGKKAGGESSAPDAPPAGTPAAPAAKQSPPAAQIPPVDDENRRSWTNYSTAPMSTKDNVSLWLYLLQGDTANYYIIAHNRRPSPCTVEFSINDERYSIDFNNGKIAVPVSVPAASFSSSASITINKVK